MTTVVQEVTKLLTADGLKVADRSIRPPFVRVNFGASSEIDPALARGNVAVWCVVSWGQDPQPQAAKVWRALRNSGRYIPQAAISQAPGPGEDPQWDVVLIVADTSFNWWLAENSEA